ncbi:MAG: GntR family transcriptional regulator [Erysipelotrichaceae bacterium]|nr:GntR family transcriptional regulator [Erysipelotrichaceae bacterium]
MFVLKPQSGLPIFEQLKAQMLEFVALGILSPNDKLPSVRSLAMELSINPNTVAKAYQELELQGYVYTVPGKGCFVSDNHIEEQIHFVKLTEFIQTVKEMKRHNIKENELVDAISLVYGGEKHDGTSSDQ